MRASEILRGLADLIDNVEQGGEQQQPQAAIATSTEIEQPKAHLAVVDVDNQDDTDKTTMVPPLQQKIELLKKSVNVDNEFDQGFDQVDQEQKGEQEVDELAVIKKNAGINPQQIAQHELAKDEPLDI